MLRFLVGLAAALVTLIVVATLLLVFVHRTGTGRPRSEPPALVGR